jgi:hypothetical protein
VSMSRLAVRWSEAEAGKPYARPFMVTFVDGGGDAAASIAVSGSDLLYYRQFQAAVLALAGELFHDDSVESSGDPQRAWLDRLGATIVTIDDVGVVPESKFDEHHGRAFTFRVESAGKRPAHVDARTLTDYQELQAALAHQSGCLFRDRLVETIDDAQQRSAAWVASLRLRLARPAPDEAVAAVRPW